MRNTWALNRRPLNFLRLLQRKVHHLEEQRVVCQQELDHRRGEVSDLKGPMGMPGKMSTKDHGIL